MLSQTNGAKGGVLKILASCGWYFNKYLSMYSYKLFQATFNQKKKEIIFN